MCDARPLNLAMAAAMVGVASACLLLPGLTASQAAAASAERWSLVSGTTPLALTAPSLAVEEAREALSRFQQSAAESESGLDRRAIQPLWRNLADSLIALLNADAPGMADGAEVSVEARNAIVQLEDPTERVSRLERLARVEVDNRRFDSAEQALDVAWRSVPLIASEAERDAFKVRMAAIGSALPATARAEARQRAITIADIDARIAALSGLALADVADGTVGAEAKEILATAGDVAERDARFLALADRFLLVGFSDLATILALASESTPAARDSLLAQIVEREVVWEVDTTKLYAHRVIRDRDLAATAGRRVVTYELSAGQLSAARDTADGIVVSATRWAALLEISDWLLAEHYTAQAEGLVARVEREAGSAGATGFETLLYPRRMAILLQRKQPKAVMKLWQAGARDNPGVRAQAGQIARLLADADMNRELIKLTEDTADSASASLVAAERARYALRNRRYADAEDLSEEVGDPRAVSMTRLELIAEPVLWRDQTPAGSDTQSAWLEEAERLAASKGPGEGELLRVRLIRTLASLGLYDRAVEIAQGLGPERQRDLDIQSALAIAAARAGDMPNALRRIGRLPESGSRTKAVRDLAEVMVEQGAVREATALVRSIRDWRDRAKGFSSIARLHGRLVTESGDLTGYVEQRPWHGRSADAVLEAGKAKASPQVPLFTAGTFKFFGGKDPGEAPRLPELPDLEGTLPADIKAQVPAINPGRLHVTFLQYSQYNKKFMADVGKVDLARSAQQSRHPRYIFLETGVFDLPTIYQMLMDKDEAYVIERDKRDYTVRMPVLIGPEATLVLSGADVSSLRLSKEYSSYLVNAGKLFIVGTTLKAWSEEKQDVAILTYEAREEFRPFFLGWSGSQTFVTQSRISGLGYQSDKSYGMSFSSGPADLLQGFGARLARPWGIMTDSIFDEMLYGFYSYEADGIKVVGNTYENNVVYGVDPHDRSRHLTFAFNTAYGTRKAHGFIGSREVDGAWWIGNIAFDNHGSGMMIDRDSKDNRIFGNVLFDNKQDGLTFFESSCALVVGNALFGNERNGTLIRNSWSISFLRNVVVGNEKTPLTAYATILDQPYRDYEMDPYVPVASITVADNLLASEGSLLNLKSIKSVTLGKNQYRGVRLLSGMNRKIERELVSISGQGATVVDQCATPLPTTFECGLAEEGFIATEQPLASERVAADCPEPGESVHAADERGEDVQ